MKEITQKSQNSDEKLDVIITEEELSELLRELPKRIRDLSNKAVEIESLEI